MLKSVSIIKHKLVGKLTALQTDKLTSPGLSEKQKLRANPEISHFQQGSLRLSMSLPKQTARWSLFAQPIDKARRPPCSETTIHSNSSILTFHVYQENCGHNERDKYPSTKVTHSAFFLGFQLILSRTLPSETKRNSTWGVTKKKTKLDYTVCAGRSQIPPSPNGTCQCKGQ